MNRPNKDNYYLDVAETILKRSTCLRRNFGAVIVKNDQIISCGYTGAPRGRLNCSEIGKCIRMELNIPRGERYEFCRSVHAEANAIIQASRGKMLGSTLYLVGIEFESQKYVINTAPCAMCKRLIINAGIKKVIARETSTRFNTFYTQSWIEFDDSLKINFGY